MDASNYGSEALPYGNVTASTTVSGTPTISRKHDLQRGIMLFNNSSTQICYVGSDSSVSTTTGYPLPPGDSESFDTRSPIWIISTSGNADIRWIAGAA